MDRSEGNKHFKAKDYANALENYRMALAGVDASQRHLLWSNMSACYFEMKKYDEATQCGLECIAFKPDWAKGYFRTAKALQGRGSHETAVKILEKALDTIDKSNEIDCQDLSKQLEDARHQLSHAKSMQRATVDYARFDNLQKLLEYEEAVESAIAANSVPQVIPTADCDEKQLRDIQLALSGKTVMEEETQIDGLIYDPVEFRNVKLELLEKDVKDSIIGLTNVLSLRMLSAYPNIISKMLNTSGFYENYTSFAIKHLMTRASSYTIEESSNSRVLCLGIGSGVMQAAIARNTLLTTNPLSIHSVGRWESPAECHFAAGVYSKLNEEERSKWFLRQVTIMRLAEKGFQNVVIDPCFFDYSGIVHETASIIRRARNTQIIQDDALVFPAEVHVNARLVSVKMSSNRTGVNMQHFQSSRGWFPGMDKLNFDEIVKKDVLRSSSNLETCTFASERITLVKFKLDGKLENLDVDVPKSIPESSFTVHSSTQTTINAVLITFDAFSRNSEGICEQVLSNDPITCAANPGTAQAAKAVGQGIFWVDTLQTVKDDAVTLNFRMDLNRLHITINNNNNGLNSKMNKEESTALILPSKPRNAVLNRMLLTALSDSTLIETLDTAIRHKVRRTFLKARDAATSSTTPKFLLPSNSSTCLLPLFVAREVAQCYFSSSARPFKSIETVAFDPSPMQVELVKKSLHSLLLDPLKQDRNSANVQSAVAEAAHSERISAARKAIHDMKVATADIRQANYNETPANHLILDGFDCGALGEGAVAMIGLLRRKRFAPPPPNGSQQEPIQCDALLSKGASVLPARIRLYSFLAEVGESEMCGVDVTSWHRYSGSHQPMDYKSLKWNQTGKKIVTKPTQIASFNLDPANMHITNEKKSSNQVRVIVDNSSSLNNVTSSVKVNSVITFYAIDFPVLDPLSPSDEVLYTVICHTAPQEVIDQAFGGDEDEFKQFISGGLSNPTKAKILDKITYIPPEFWNDNAATTTDNLFELPQKGEVQIVRSANAEQAFLPLDPREVSIASSFQIDAVIRDGIDTVYQIKVIENDVLSSEEVASGVENIPSPASELNLVVVDPGWVELHRKYIEMHQMVIQQMSKSGKKFVGDCMKACSVISTTLGTMGVDPYEAGSMALAFLV